MQFYMCSMTHPISMFCFVLSAQFRLSRAGAETAFVKSDKGKLITIDAGSVCVDGLSRTIHWGDIPVPQDCVTTIVSVDWLQKGLVKLDNGELKIVLHDAMSRQRRE